MDEESGREGGTTRLAGGSDPSISRAVVDLDRVFTALAHPRRRHLLYAMLVRERWTLPELAGQIAAWEQDRPVSDVDENHRTEVYVSLHHAHVPLLVNEGVIEFDDRDETLTPGPNADQVLSLLRRADALVDADGDDAGPDRVDTDDSAPR